ncbi:MAG: 8-oxo-dGDP phosphatase [Frankiales bacterium]|nr:8-oxo-dGDP phosphatase [Frankiales bacterium]
MPIEDAPRHYPISGSTHRFTGPVIAVRTDEVVFPDGGTARRDVVEHPGAVAVIALGDGDQVLFVQQYRHPPGRMLWEPPAGLLDEPGEAPAETAARELFEEAGYRAGRWDVLLDAFTTPGMSDEAIRIYLARDISEVADDERHVGEHEEADMPTEWVPLDTAVAAILAGRLHNPLAVMGVLAARCARDSGWADLRPADSPWPERPVSGVKG